MAARLENLENILARRRRLAARRAAAVALLAGEGRRGDQLSRKSLEEVLRVAEAARAAARESYILQGGRLRLLLRG